MADAAEAASHHPDIDIRWNNKVTLTLTTHSADRFISNDTTSRTGSSSWSATITTRRAWLGRDIDRGGQASAAGAARPGDSAPADPHHRL